ncbi:MAG: cysteine--tRNA ligase [Ignavibacteriaceae bacterium]
MLFIYNTLTKQKEEFKPITPHKIKMYVCGPTVYDYFHIGNARSFIMSDIIRKYLEFKGFDIKYVMNLTDVDDKIIKKSNEEKVEARIVAEKYTKAFFEDAEKLKIKKADINPKATEHIEDIIGMIKELKAKRLAYEVDGNVFYDVRKFKEYGKLSGKKLDELESGARVEVNVEKRDPLDFALWKKAKEGEPFWKSPWGAGRPGWHIECSAMSCKHLGETFDIHAGGHDLIFPHHENEIAQSEGATGKKFVNYWLHFGFLNIDNEKMSKSLGNFFTARDILKKYSSEAIRLAFAQTHYAGPLNFSDELLSSAEKGLEKLNNLAEKIENEINVNITDGMTQEFDFEKYKNDFISSMDDDFNSPQACAVIFDFIREVNKTISENEKINAEFYSNVKDFLKQTAEGVLGILDFSKVSTQSSGELQIELIELFIKIRTDAKNEKNFALADKIRDELKEIGITLQDSKAKTTYKIVNR